MDASGVHLPQFPEIPFTPEVLNSRSNMTQNAFIAFFSLANSDIQTGFGNIAPIQCITDFEFYMPNPYPFTDATNVEYKFTESRKTIQRTISGDKVILGNYIESHYLSDPTYWPTADIYYPETILKKTLFDDSECLRYDGDSGGLSGTLITPFSPDYTQPVIRTKQLGYIEDLIKTQRVPYGINFLLTDDWNVKQIPANTTFVWPVDVSGVLDYFEDFDNLLNQYNIAHCPNFGYPFTNYDHTPAPITDAQMEFFASRAEMVICESLTNILTVATNQTALLTPTSGDISEFVRRHQLFIDNQCMLNFLPLHFIWNADPYTNEKFLGTYAQIMGHTLVGWSELQPHREWIKYPKVFGQPTGNVQQIGPSGLVLSRQFEKGTLMLDMVSRCRTSGNFKDDVKMCVEEALLYDIINLSTTAIYSVGDDVGHSYARNNGSAAGTGGFWNDSFFDCVPPTISGSRNYGSCLVTPDILLSSYANHASGTVHFVDNVNNVSTRTITSGMRVGSTDIYVQKLDSPLSTSFATTMFNPAAILPANYASKIPNVSGIPVMMYDPNTSYRKLFVGEWTAISGGNVVVHQPPSGLYQNWYSPPSGNCAGSPCFIQLGEQLILLTQWSSFNGVDESYGPSLADNITGINSAITTLGSTSQLKIALLEHNLY